MRYVERENTERLAVIIEATMNLASTGIKQSCQILTESAGDFDAYATLLEAVDEAAEGVAELTENKKTIKERLKSIKDAKAVQAIMDAVKKIINWIVSKAKSLKAAVLGKKALESVETQVEHQLESAQEEGDTEKVGKLKSVLNAIKAGIQKAKAKITSKKKDEGDSVQENADLFEDSEANMFENPLEDPTEGDDEETNDPEINAIASGGDEEDWEDQKEADITDKIVDLIESASTLSRYGVSLSASVLTESAGNIGDRRVRKYMPILEAYDTFLLEAEEAEATESTTKKTNKLVDSVKEFMASISKKIKEIKDAGVMASICAAITGMVKKVKDFFAKFKKEGKKDPQAEGKLRKLWNTLKSLPGNLKATVKSKFKKGPEADKAMEQIDKLEEAFGAGFEL